MTNAKAPNARTAKAALVKKVQALLTQAADPAATEQEAQTFAAKAAELMARHSLDEATVRAEKGQKPEAVTVLRFEVSGQGWHGKGRAEMVARVAEGYGCVVITENNVMNGKPRWVHIVGTASAVAALEVLLPSIILQAEYYGTKATKDHMAKIRDQFPTQQEANRARRVFFRSYLPGYGIGVAEKIMGAREQMAKDVENTPGALVLVSDQERVAAHFEKLYPSENRTPVKRDNHSAAGAAAGRRDGRTADTGQTRVNGNKKAVAAKPAARKRAN
ncbi:DUF2786 domain-containing protein [Saccharothrix sp. NPDC042600]|uniref:DUF2786 domain-containing protein n=1 Tax=Saccharothrix TaxID=2071 RepID=UPI0033D0DBBA|nr:hypothetical protein GCM10017745_30640 [Saccharothrix mutabilis subsp. capreolus]